MIISFQAGELDAMMTDKQRLLRAAASRRSHPAKHQPVFVEDSVLLTLQSVSGSLNPSDRGRPVLNS